MTSDSKEGRQPELVGGGREWDSDCTMGIVFMFRGG